MMICRPSHNINDIRCKDFAAWTLKHYTVQDSQKVILEKITPAT